MSFDQTKYYKITNQVSGFGLLAGSWGHVPSDKMVWQYLPNDDDGNPLFDSNGFLWQLVSDSDGYTRIINKVSGFAL